MSKSKKDDDFCGINPCGFRVVVMLHEKASPILMPSGKTVTSGDVCKVVRVGPDVEGTCKPGDKVLIDPRGQVIPFNSGNIKYFITESHFVIAVLEEKE